MKTAQQHQAKALAEETTAHESRTPLFGHREQANAWKRAATAWTSAAFATEDQTQAGVFALSALKASRNAQRVAEGKSVPAAEGAAK